jgi:hypothetical protein
MSDTKPQIKKAYRKRAGGVDQGVEQLPSKCEALSSKPSTAKKNLPFKKACRTPSRRNDNKNPKPRQFIFRLKKNQ